MGRRRPVEGSALSGTALAPAAVPVSSIALNPRNPRDNYQDVEELQASISEVGILQPIGVVRYETYLTHYPEDERAIGVCDWVVLHGNRRVVAAQAAGLPEVPVHVVDRLGRDGQLDESVLIENIHREALPPLREAEALRLLVERHGSQRTVARRIGKSGAFVSQRLSLLKLEPQFREELATGTLGIREALAIASRPAEEQSTARQELRDRSSARTEQAAAGTTVESQNGDHPPRSRSTNTKAAQRVQQSTTVRVRVDSVSDTAEDLRAHFDTEALAELAELLAPVEHRLSSTA